MPTSLAAARHAAGLTQEDIAAHSGLSVQTIRTLKSVRQPGNPRLTTLYALGDALGLPPRWTAQRVS